MSDSLAKVQKQLKEVVLQSSAHVYECVRACVYERGNT